MISIGITGIIGSGKSMLSQTFRSMGIPVYDADSKAKLLMNSDIHIKEELIRNFGENTYADGKINKDHLRRIVFGDEAKRLIVNSIVHPAVKKDYLQWRMESGSNINALESAIIFEAGLEDILDRIIYVEAAENILVDRICKRDNVSEETAIKKIRLQKENSGRNRCDAIFTNDRSHSLIEQAENFINNLKL